MISVLILTRDEEQDLPGCLDAIPWCDDVHVMDSGSTDRTVEIARERGAHVTVQTFANFAAQRNAGLQLSFRYGWLLVLDADERPTPELSAEMQRAVLLAPDTVGAFEMQRRDFLWGTWLRHAQMTPFYVRLLRAGRVTYTRAVNEVAQVQGSVVRLRSPLDHLAFSKGIAHWVEKHNRYSDTEAQLLHDGRHTLHAAGGEWSVLWRQALFTPQFHERRIAQKTLFYQLPARPVIKWLYLMVVRAAFLDGAAGVMYTTLISYYEYLIVIKTRELERIRDGEPL